MLLTLVKHLWLDTSRSSSFGRTMAMRLVMALLFFFLLFYLILISFGIALGVQRLENVDPIALVNSYLLYYLLFELALRFFLQSLPGFNVGAYLHLPLSKKTIAAQQLLRSFFSPYNIITPILFTPFALMVIGEHYGTVSALTWLLSLVFLSWSMHYALLWFKRAFARHLWIIYLLLLGGIALFGLQFFQWVPSGDLTARFFEAAHRGPWGMLLSVLLFVGAIYLCLTFYTHNLYLDLSNNRRAESVAGEKLSAFSRFGVTGSLIDLELKLILRHKRTRSTLMLSGLFVLYGLLFFPGMEPADDGRLPMFMLIFLGTFLTGVFIMQYGQFLMSWHSAFFDFFHVQPLTAEQYINSRYYLLVSVGLLSYALAVPYVYFGTDVLLANTAMLLYNAGINTYIIMALSMWSPQKLDLTQRGGFSMQGVGASQWLMGLPVFIGPMLLFAPFWLMGYTDAGLAVLALAGLTGLLLRTMILRGLSGQLSRLRHDISAAFRSE